ncbi:hypothetical protein BJY52DRAFT_1227548 [Lactarius psammicola]|nr:hypothetical protein BJY52DRAFT_1227548 [Lactarius psammicola]
MGTAAIPAKPKGVLHADTRGGGVMREFFTIRVGAASTGKGNTVTPQDTSYPTPGRCSDGGGSVFMWENGSIASVGGVGLGDWALTLLHPPWSLDWVQRKLELGHGLQVVRIKPGVKVIRHRPPNEGRDTLYLCVVVEREPIPIENDRVIQKYESPREYVYKSYERPIASRDDCNMELGVRKTKSGNVVSGDKRPTVGPLRKVLCAIDPKHDDAYVFFF